MMLEAGEGTFEVLETARNGKQETYVVRCGKKTFIYLYNGSDTVFDTAEITFGKTGKVRISRLDTDKVKLGKAYKSDAEGSLKLEGLSLQPLEEAVLVVE